jgi:hypothetical protein
MKVIRELKRRKIFQVAAVYLVVAWLIAQVVDVVNDPLSLPLWFDTVVILLLAIGFPVAVILAWAFDVTPEGVKRASANQVSAPSDSRKLEYVLLGVIAVGIGWLVVRDSISLDSAATRTGETPVVIIMDTFAPKGVYDQETRDNSGTNADVLNDVLRGLPIVIQKEAIGSTWDREDQILRQNPDLILIHRSGFFHSMNLEMGFGYGDEPATLDERRWQLLYEYADNKLQAFLGIVGQGNPNTVFLVYSRGTGGGSTDDYYIGWINQLEGRFPSLAGRVHAVVVPGGVGNATFRDPETARLVSQRVQSLLGIEDGQ